MTFFATNAVWNSPMSSKKHTVVQNEFVDVSEKEEEQQQQNNNNRNGSNKKIFWLSEVDDLNNVLVYV